MFAQNVTQLWNSSEEIQFKKANNIKNSNKFVEEAFQKRRPLGVFHLTLTSFPVEDAVLS